MKKFFFGIIGLLLLGSFAFASAPKNLRIIKMGTPDSALQALGEERTDAIKSIQQIHSLDQTDAELVYFVRAGQHNFFSEEQKATVLQMTKNLIQAWSDVMEIKMSAHASDIATLVGDHDLAPVEADLVFLFHQSQINQVSAEKAQRSKTLIDTYVSELLKMIVDQRSH